MVKKRNLQKGLGHRVKYNRKKLVALRKASRARRGNQENSDEDPPTVIEVQKRSHVSPMSTSVALSTRSKTSDESPTWERDTHHRIAIAQVYKHHLLSPPKDQDSQTIQTIQKMFPTYSRTVIANVICNCRESEKRNKVYSCQRASRRFLGEYLIPPGSIYEQVIVDFIEEGYAAKTAKFFVNKLLREDNK